MSMFSSALYSQAKRTLILAYKSSHHIHISSMSLFKHCPLLQFNNDHVINFCTNYLQAITHFASSLYSNKGEAIKDAATTPSSFLLPFEVCLKEFLGWLHHYSTEKVKSLEKGQNPKTSWDFCLLQTTTAWGRWSPLKTVDLLQISICRKGEGAKCFHKERYWSFPV